MTNSNGEKSFSYPSIFLNWDVINLDLDSELYGQ